MQEVVVLCCLGIDVYHYVVLVLLFLEDAAAKRKTEVCLPYHFFRYVIPAFLLFAFGVTFVSYAMDLPAVIAKEPSRYEGACEIVMEELEEDVFTVEAMFDDTWAEYEHDQVPLIKEGDYYCEVDYYPGSSIGTSLKLYLESGGKAVQLK
ncbi:hypothetical protein QMA09_09120 [Planococcus sp. APC 3906]|uniref:hypothetical protein n=1 Tax=Planococcus sp. APC 3906 TaxID=3035194 RepID=UPI0025B2D345|nr:hypothetical protein [Planococcus sp. APC 3906]MDN3450351.1 hypothetical protein [Planococcus sp. APC 3906]